MNWIEVIASLIAGGTITTVFNYFLAKKKDNRDTFEAIIKVWAEDNQRLRQETVKLDNEIKQLQQSIVELQSKLIILESSQADLPIPMWVKDLNSIVLYVNDAYEREFLKPFGYSKYDYIGKTDFQIWPEELARNYVQNDRKVIDSKIILYTVEQTSNEADGEKWFIIKYLRYAAGKPIGIAGIAIPKKQFDDLLSNT